jgi:hypothetical protein
MLEGAGSQSVKHSLNRSPARQVVSSFMLNGENQLIIPSADDMPPPPPRQLKWSANEADVSASLNRQALDDAQVMAPPFARTIALGISGDSSRGPGRDRSVSNVDARGRDRSVSNVDIGGEGSGLTKPRHQRTRSASLGAAPASLASTGSCDTILEEEINESAKETIDFEFDIDLARETP